MSVTQTMIDQADASIRATWPAYTAYIHADTFVGTGTVQPSVPALSINPVSVNVDGTSATSQSVPQSQVWRLDDIYTNSAADTAVQALVQFTKNKIKTMGNTANIATQVVSNQTRPGLPSVFVYEPQSSLQINTLPVAANGTTTATNTFYVSVMIYDSSFG